jgi:hypothetical protein
MPKSDETEAKHGRFAQTIIGYVHIDVCELRSAGKVHMFLAIDRVSKFAYVELHPAATMLAGAEFLRGVIVALPYRLHTVLTDNGIPSLIIPATARVPQRNTACMPSTVSAASMAS